MTGALDRAAALRETLLPTGRQWLEAATKLTEQLTAADQGALAQLQAAERARQEIQQARADAQRQLAALTTAHTDHVAAITARAEDAAARTARAEAQADDATTQLTTLRAGLKTLRAELDRARAGDTTTRGPGGASRDSDPAETRAKPDGG